MENMESNTSKSNENCIEKIGTESTDAIISLNKELKVVVENIKSNVSKSNKSSTDDDIEKDNVNADTSGTEIDTNAKEEDKSNEFTMSDTIEHSDKLQLLTSDGEDGDDIPGDFFDDFLKEDFMAGLDVVDDDDWNETKRNADLESSENRAQFQEKQEKPSDQTVEKTNKEKKNKKSRLKEEKATKSNRNQKKSSDIGIHRDPKKTRRDIELDKARCEKDKEMKRISEKLRIVETGLVPPGMEMETDIEVIEKQKELERKNNLSSMEPVLNKKCDSPSQDHSVYTESSVMKKTKSPRHLSRNSMHKSRSPLRSRTSPRRGRYESPLKSRITRVSPQMLHDRHESSLKSGELRDRRQSPLRSRDRRDSSPISRDRRESPLRSRGRRQSPVRSHDRHESLVKRDRHDSPKRSRRLDSPLRSRHETIGRSRESPLKRKSRIHSSRRSQDRSRSRSRDRRHRRSRSRSFKRKREEKMSFLQEIAEKLRNPVSFQSHTSSVDMYHMGPQVISPASVPTPVPAPPLSTQYPLQPPRYDQNFFIGTPQTNITQSQPLHYQVGLHGQIQNQVPIHQQTVHQQQFSTSMQANFSQSHMQNNLELHTHAEPQSEFKAKDDMHKLYEDKKITLADFLAITAKPEVYSASPEQMKEKIKVISRCQDAIKYLGNTEKHFTGPLILHKNDSNSSMLSQDKFKSPLLKSSQVKFPFTEIPNTAQQKSKLLTRINSLLENLCLANDVIVIDDGPEVNNETLNSSFVPPAAPVISSVTNNRINDIWQSARHGDNQLSKFSQTDAPRCAACEKRSKIVTKSVGVQSGNDFLKFSVGTQVREESFYPTLPKNQSLASLTPAQLLARSVATGSSRNNEDDDYDVMFSAKKSRPSGFPNRISTQQQAPPPPRGLFDSSKYNYF